MLSRRSYLYLFLFLIALFLRLGFLAWNWSDAPDWNIDALGYHQLAVNVLQRGIFSLNTEPPFSPDGIRTPGYPLFLAIVYSLTGVAPHAILLLQAFLDAITVVFAADLAQRLAGSNTTALLTGLLYAFLPLAWRYASELYVESFLAFWLTLTFWMSLKIVQSPERGRWLSAAALGVITGVSLLIKPNVILLPFFVAAVLLAHRLYRQTLVFAAALAIALTPWLARNAITFGHLTLSTAFMNNLVQVSAPATLARVRGESVVPWTPRWEALSHEVEAAAAQENPDIFALSEAQAPRLIYRRQVALADAAKAVIRAHPQAFLTSHFAGALRGWMPMEQRFWYERLTGQRWDASFPDGIVHNVASKGWRQTPALALVLFLLFLAWQFLRVSAAALGVALLYPRNRTFVIAAALFILYVTTLPGPIAYDRFHMPIMPLLHVFMAAGLIGAGRWMLSHFQSRNSNSELAGA